MLTPVIDGICRAEGARVLAGLIRRFGEKPSQSTVVAGVRIFF